MDAKPTVFDVELPSFATDVVERSKEIPVILLFWTDQIPPSADTKRHLEMLASQYQGKFALALCDVAQTPELAQQLRVQGIPSIRAVVNGQIASQLDGPQGEAVLRQMIDELTMSGSDRLKEGLERFVATRDWEGALAILRQALAEEPNNPAFRVEVADVLVRKGDLDDARVALGSISEDTPERDRPAARLEIAEEATAIDGGDRSSRSQPGADDLDALYDAAVREAAAENYEAALEYCMTILRTDRKFREDIGRKTMIKVMTAMGKGSELAQQYRRRMFAFMH
ncbi:MAG: tetratricopeptide repeat protein [Gammaproteobacteria bacterium]|nr:tetratricopeptide repeat protein [Gammaproteobacteria bacterium]MDE0453388.1 tetratricopeptide repeat protein [Gammaproteobacteria bacterium]